MKTRGRMLHRKPGLCFPTTPFYRVIARNRGLMPWPIRNCSTRSGLLPIMTAKDVRIFVSELSDGSRCPASEIRDSVCDCHRFPTGPLIRRYRERALDDGRRQAFSHAACPGPIR